MESSIHKLITKTVHIYEVYALCFVTVAKNGVHVLYSIA
jgi:hypothetical protein